MFLFDSHVSWAIESSHLVSLSCTEAPRLGDGPLLMGFPFALDDGALVSAILAADRLPCLRSRGNDAGLGKEVNATRAFMSCSKLSNRV